MKSGIRFKNLILALILALILLFPLNIPASALSLDEFFSISYSAQFSSTSVTENTPFTVTVTGTASCTKDLTAPYNWVTQARITGRIVGINQATGNKVTLNPSYILIITPFPTKAGQSSSDSQTLNLQFPAEAGPGTYRVEGELIEGKVEAVFWLTVTEYLPPTKVLGTVSYTAAGSPGGGGGGSIPSPSPTNAPTSTPANSNQSPIDITNKDMAGFLNFEYKTTSGLIAQPAGKECQITIKKDTRVIFPQDAEPIITVNQIDNPYSQAAVSLVGYIYNFNPSGTSFSPPVTLTFDYGKIKLPAGVFPRDLAIGTFDSAANAWILLESTIDEARHTVSISVSHFSFYAIFATVKPGPASTPEPTTTPAEIAKPSLLPATFAFSNISVEPENINSGEPVQINFAVTNTGNQPGVCRIELKLDANIFETREISLSGGEKKDLTFAISKPAPGNHTVTVADLSVDFSVAPDRSRSPVSWWILGGIIALIAVVVIIASRIISGRKRGAA